MNDKFISSWYINEYGSGLGGYKYAGRSLWKRFKEGEWVLDIGCGDNEYKLNFETVIGLDPFNPKADLKIPFEKYVPDRMFDVVLCLGVFHWGDDKFIETQINKINTFLKPGGRLYWRNHPTDTGIPEIDNPARKELAEFKDMYEAWLKKENLSIDDPGNQFDLYPWNFQKHHNLASKFGYKVTDLQYDCDVANNEHKIFAEWTKL